jgi:Flp pilus assembly pilin Flp
VPRAQLNNRGNAATSHQATAGAASWEDAMTMLFNYVKSFVSQEEGQDLLEYALLVALIALVAIVAVGAAGGSVSTIFTNISGELTAAGQ